MSTDPATYDPKYVDPDGIPISGPDDYTQSQKRRALFQAEAQFEGDVNSGVELDPDEVGQIHRAAVQALGTYKLVQGASAPDSTTLGDLADGGDRRETYAEQFEEDYNDFVETINSRVGSDSENRVYFGATGDSSDGSGSITVNGRNPDTLNDDYPFDRRGRYPDDE